MTDGILSFVKKQGKGEYSNTNELALAIAAFGSILIKFGFEDILENQTLFMEVCNQAGFRTITGKEFNKMSFRQMFARLGSETIEKIRNEADMGYVRVG